MDFSFAMFLSAATFFCYVNYILQELLFLYLTKSEAVSEFQDLTYSDVTVGKVCPVLGIFIF